MSQPIERIRRGTRAQPFDWQDSLCLEEALDEDERMVRDTARDYANSVLLPRVTEAWRDEVFAPDVLGQS